MQVMEPHVGRTVPSCRIYNVAMRGDHQHHAYELKEPLHKIDNLSNILLTLYTQIILKHT